MSQYTNPYEAPVDLFAAQAATDARTDFITKTYTHLVGAVGLFVLLETVILSIPGIENLMVSMFSSRFSWLVVLAAFMGISYVANSWALNSTSLGMQYLGLGVYVVAEAVVFAPLLWIAKTFGPEGVIFQAALTTLGLFGALTLAVFVTRKDFSFLRTLLVFGSIAALGLIVVAILFGFELGPIFVYAMIAMACGWILYDTSNVLHHYRIGQHVAAALALFASLALLFWYILRLYLDRD